MLPDIIPQKYTTLELLPSPENSPNTRNYLKHACDQIYISDDLVNYIPIDYPYESDSLGESCKLSSPNYAAFVAKLRFDVLDEPTDLSFSLTNIAPFSEDQPKSLSKAQIFDLKQEISALDVSEEIESDIDIVSVPKISKYQVLEKALSTNIAKFTMSNSPWSSVSVLYKSSKTSKVFYEINLEYINRDFVFVESSYMLEPHSTRIVLHGIEDPYNDLCDILYTKILDIEETECQFPSTIVYENSISYEPYDL